MFFWPSFMHLVYDHCPKNYYVNIVYVIESAAYGVLFTSSLCQKPERARYERVRFLTQARSEYTPVQSTFYVVSCLLHICALIIRPTDLLALRASHALSGRSSNGAGHRYQVPRNRAGLEFFEQLPYLQGVSEVLNFLKYITPVQAIILQSGNVY